MKKKLSVLIAVVTSVLVLAACGGKQETAGGSEEKDAVQETTETAKVEIPDLSGAWDDEVSKRASMDVTRIPRQLSGRSAGHLMKLPAHSLMKTENTPSTPSMIRKMRPYPVKRLRKAPSHSRTASSAGRTPKTVMTDSSHRISSE